MNGNIIKMMGQLKKMQKEVARIQEELSRERFVATSGGGTVKVSVNGNQEVEEITIDPAALNPEDAEILQDMLVVALNEAMDQSRQAYASKMGDLGASLGLPPGIL
jgi:DNA-binding YbaB/EbfC family protein